MLPHTHPTPATITTTRDTLCNMAQFMRENDGCTEEDLKRKGFTHVQIAHFGGEAAVLARHMSERRIRR